MNVLYFNFQFKPDESVGLAVRSWSPRDRVNPEELGSYVEGDMLIPRVDGRNGIVQTSRRWSNGVVPYVFSSSLSNSDVNIISAAIAEYHRSTCIRFVPRSNERDYISFENSNTGCWSSVGKVGDKQQVNLQSPGCTTVKFFVVDISFTTQIYLIMILPAWIKNS